ncbi:hypothetical protein GFS31_35210 [Leptolyngbya sp. BL0902]|uniref:hypothetical protein n=1 Tax=Leptolyngbya sp. BL0902 TaxID=1115757 RepID=UPI0018E7CBF9|nr:hypothetical protein [Leptolyngbya sp. BL0902]QQE66818.1 hypothetical protein GFS31_35210 [Leptolyngbya sp. BL0902]
MGTQHAIKGIGLIVVYASLSWLAWGCNPADQPPRDSHQGFEQNGQLALYQSEALGVSFPLPESTYVQAQGQRLTLWTKADYQRREEFIEATPLSIVAEENPDRLTVQAWVAAQGYQLLGDLEDQAVGGYPGLRFTWLGMWPYTSVVVAHPNRGTIITITWDNDSLDYQDWFEAIIAGLALR